MIRARMLIVTALLITPSSAANAQGSPAAAVDQRWSAWLGCWTPAAQLGTSGPETRVCFVPSGDARGVQMITFDGDREMLNEPIVADGTPQRVEDDGCAGERRAEWAQSGSRVFSASSLTCPNQPLLKTSGLFALVSADQWVDVQVSVSGDRQQVRTRRFWRASSAPPASIADRIPDAPRPRIVMAAVTIDDVIEASGKLPAVGIEAWLAESIARVAIDRRALVRLADAHVSTDVIDLMVALAYPQKFEVRRGGASGGASAFWIDPFSDGFYPGDWSYLAGMYGFGYGYPYWLGANGYYYYPGTIYYVPGSGGGSAAPDQGAHGQVVNGLGYTRVQPRERYEGTTARGGSAATASGTDGGGSGSGGSSGSSGSSGGVSTSGYSGGSGSGSTGLTAVPR